MDDGSAAFQAFDMRHGCVIENLGTCLFADSHQIGHHFVLWIDPGAFTARCLVKVQPVRAVVEAKIQRVLFKRESVHAFAQADLAHHLHSTLLEHPGAKTGSMMTDSMPSRCSK